MGYALAGLLAGLTTTVVGLGGGLMLLLALGAMAGPQAALAWTAPALLVGNVHRVWMYRSQLDRKITWALVRGALPGSLLGAVLAVGAPPLLLQLGMLAMTGVMLAQRAGWLRWRPGTRLITPASFANGAICATTGGAGALTAPLLLAAGLSGEAWIATQSAGAVAMHAGRLAGYGVGGLVSAEGLGVSAGLAAALVVGNALGGRIRTFIPARGRSGLELAAVLVCVGMALFGVVTATKPAPTAAQALPTAPNTSHVVGQVQSAAPDQAAIRSAEVHSCVQTRPLRLPLWQRSACPASWVVADQPPNR